MATVDPLRMPVPRTSAPSREGAPLHPSLRRRPESGLQLGGDHLITERHRALITQALPIRLIAGQVRDGVLIALEYRTGLSARLLNDRGLSRRLSACTSPAASMAIVTSSRLGVGCPSYPGSRVGELAGSAGRVFVGQQVEELIWGQAAGSRYLQGGRNGARVPAVHGSHQNVCWLTAS